uniref:Uncharacterized protein n=1 Tax=Physcomitrium patens TaxID=3218 RepID=A0A2K1KFV6_PHYPA|nr:uncharacterized protein LOC112283139 [Physcomitrium patens]PNR52667.1 hypothetical protein PHYPA_009041 [Physcomitrium patens]|eukprot:XP_024377267.1 uncharacterized protein LOC112283139 [Physcomitrella patens]
MEGGMPSMAKNVGVGGIHVEQVGGYEALDNVDGRNDRNELNERQLAEKLGKSEAGRKKLRQAIVLLKEKLEATSATLGVNDVLRQEVERERLNVDAERKRAGAEKLLREKVEKENLTIKEQFLDVLHRLDFLESSYKVDRNEFSRIHSEVKEVVGGIGAALQAVEATKSLYQSLERSIHAKINGVVQSSSRALAIAQSGRATASRAQATAEAAQSLSKAVQMEVRLVSSQVSTLQKQTSNLVAVEASLQQESQLKGPGTPLNSPDSGETNICLSVLKQKVSADVFSPSSSGFPAQVTVASKNQTQERKSSQEKVDPTKVDILNMLVASKEKSRNNQLSSNATLPRGGMILSRSQLPDGGSKSQTVIPQVLSGVSNPRKGQSESVNREEFTPIVPFKKCSVSIITGVDSVLSPAVRVPAPLDSATKSAQSLYITPLNASANPVEKVNELQSQLVSSVSKGCSNKRPAVKRGGRDLNDTRPVKAMNLSEGNLLRGALRSKSAADVIRKKTTTASNPAVCNEIKGDGISSEGVSQSNDKPYPNTATKLLKSIMKTLEKESKSRRIVEDKLMALRETLESGGRSEPMAQIGSKRKRESKKDNRDGTSEDKEKKRNRQREESRKKIINSSRNDIVTSPVERRCTIEDKCILQEETQQRDNLITGDRQPIEDRLSEMMSTLLDRCRREGFFKTPGDCQGRRDVPGAEECKDVSGVDICYEDVSGEGTDTNTDLESTDDDLGDDWWTGIELLSPLSGNDIAS